jgi:hypothetical protein
VATGARKVGSKIAGLSCWHTGSTILLATCYGTSATASLGAFLGALGGIFLLLLLLLRLCCRRNTEHSNDCEKPKHGPPPYNDNAQQYVAIRFATMGMSACGP